MSQNNRNLPNNPGNQKPYKGQKRKTAPSKGTTKPAKDNPPYMKALLDDLAPTIKNYLNQAAENKARIADAREKSAETVAKLIESLPEIIQQTIPKMVQRRKKITPQKQKTLDLINKLCDEDNMTYEEVAAYLTKNNIPTFSGRGRWHTQTIHRLYMHHP